MSRCCPCLLCCYRVNLVALFVVERAGEVPGTFGITHTDYKTVCIELVRAFFLFACFFVVVHAIDYFLFSCLTYLTFFFTVC